MKALPKRKGNGELTSVTGVFPQGLNESPSEKEGKFAVSIGGFGVDDGLNESPSEKEGKSEGNLPHC